MDDVGYEPRQMGDQLPQVQLGSGLQVAMLAAGSTHNCAVFTNGRIKCWGCACALLAATAR